MLLNKNDIVEATLLMDATWCSDSYTYERNEMYWIQNLINHVSQQEQGNKNYLALKVLDDNTGLISAFMTASTFNESYNGSVVMNVDDMIIDVNQTKHKNAKDVSALFDMMIEYCKDNGIVSWRADSIHESKEAKNYIEFLNKRYEGTLSYTYRGKV